MRYGDYQPTREAHFPRTPRGFAANSAIREHVNSPMQDWVEERSGRKCHKDDAMFEMYRISGGRVRSY